MATSKEELARGFADARTQLQGLVQEVSEEDWQKGVYQDGWNAKEILAHISSYDHAATLDTLVRQAKGETVPPRRPPDMSLDEYNEMRVRELIEMSVADLAKEVDERCAGAIAKLEATPQEDLDLMITSGFGAGGTIGDLAHRIGCAHLSNHIADIRQAVRPSA